MNNKISKYTQKLIPKENLIKSFQGWQAYAKWANTYKLRNKFLSKLK
jgi:hypothetical protein